jgi:hypothetical protein
MNRRGFFDRLSKLGAAIVGLPIVKLFYDPVTQAVVTPVDPVSVHAIKMFGYKGPQFMETGMVYAPYIPLYFTNEDNRQMFHKKSV